MADFEDLTQERRVYELGLAFADGAQALGRLLHQGIGPGNRERAQLRALARELGALAAVLQPTVAGDGRGAGLPGDRMAATFLRMVQPTWGRHLAHEHLVRGRDLLVALVQGEPGLEKVVVHPAQLAWLHEFLSDCCMLVLRGVATRRLGQP